MSSTKKRKAPLITDTVCYSDSEDPDDFEAIFNCSSSNEPRKPIILEPEIIDCKVKGNEVTQLWGLSNPCKCKARVNAADVIVSAIKFWNPFALLKLLNLSVSQIHWSVSVVGMDFCVRRSWQFVQATIDKRTLSYHIHDDCRWQLVGSECWSDDNCIMHHSEEDSCEYDHTISDRIVAGRLDNCLLWHKVFPELSEYNCNIITKDGNWIYISEYDTADSNVTVAKRRRAKCRREPLQPDSDSESKTVTAKATSTGETD